MSRCDPFHDRQTQPCGATVSLFTLQESIEDPTGNPGRDPGARIAHGDTYPRSVDAGRGDDTPAIRRQSNGVVEKVRDALDDPVSVDSSEDRLVALDAQIDRA